MYTVLPRSNLTPAVRLWFVQFAVAVRAVAVRAVAVRAIAVRVAHGCMTV